MPFEADGVPDPAQPWPPPEPPFDVLLLPWIPPPPPPYVL